ncbi:type II restriction endonuclease [Pseudomonas trivialis]|uniref:EcoRII C terminal n=1 Tax=Pseudomonas trivialis TaxID=200450 RepID=A0ABY0TXL9_9PSED|nr:type II restriction endonuclease [Pseudomonas trivialis]SDR70079.1 EcoRII C terminal [Pseudomonas trivialis]
MGDLRGIFTDVGAKYLTKVDVGKQHEIGSNNFTQMLGDPGSQKIPFECMVLYIDEELESPIVVSSTMTWYDTRLSQPGRNPEFRLYYKKSDVSERIREGDFCLVAIRPDKTLLIVFTPANSTVEQQLRWLFGIADLPEKGFGLKEVDYSRKVSIVEAVILEALGVEVRQDDENWLDTILNKFGASFPKTHVFSEFARATCPCEVSAARDPDLALLKWIEHEEMLFRTLERKIVQEQLDSGFGDVDHFVKFSLSVQNRRKSRIGHALEHHLAAVFHANELRFERQVVTEHRSTADFLFPGYDQYHDSLYPAKQLFMLASKSTCKDRWRQVLSEAERIRPKHLLTLEPSISAHQTFEMKEHGLQLVVPSSLRETYKNSQRGWLLDIQEFIDLVRTHGAG